MRRVNDIICEELCVFCHSLNPLAPPKYPSRINLPSRVLPRPNHFLLNRQQPPESAGHATPLKIINVQSWDTYFLLRSRCLALLSRR